MQPYFLPYIGYFQLISKVDEFVFFDDVDFNRRGWIQRNFIESNGNQMRVGVPVAKVHLGTPIHQVRLADNFPKWRSGFLKTLQNRYSNAPHFGAVYAIIERDLEETIGLLAQLNISLIQSICHYVGLDQTFDSSRHYSSNSNLGGEARLIDICLQKRANEYVNAPNGRSLYDKVKFNMHQIKLLFLEPEIRSYSRMGADFIPHLSVLDMLMFIEPEKVLQHFRSGAISP